MIETLGLVATTFGVGIASGAIPVINLEIYLVGVVLVVGGWPMAIALGVACALGQMVSKIGLYHAAHGLSVLGRKRYAGGIDRARALVDRWKDKPLMLVFVSATVGLPPFYIVSLAAGFLNIRLVPYLLIGLAGRTIRYVTIALIAALA